MVTFNSEEDNEIVDTTSVPGVAIHYSDDLLPEDVTILHGIRVTTVPRTLLDLATCMSEAELEDAFARALNRGLTNPAELARTVARHPRHRGRERLASLLERHTSA